MRLSRQLLLISLLVLMLPVTGIFWVQDMALTLREQQSQVLNASLKATAASLALRDTFPEQISETNAVYIQSSSSGLILDGYFEDWYAQGLVSRLYGSGGVSIQPQVQFIGATDGDNLFLALQVKHRKRNGGRVIYYSPVGKTLENGDRVQLSFLDGQGKSSQYTIVTEAPGSVIARTQNIWNGISRVVRENRIRGAWREIPKGYQLELILPLSMAGKQLGFTVIDGENDSWTSSVASGEEPGSLVLPDKQLSETLSFFTDPEMRLGVVNNTGLQVADTGEAEQSGIVESDQPFWMVEWLFRTILRWDTLPSYKTHWADGDWSGAGTTSIVDNALAGSPDALWLRQHDNYSLLAAWPLEREGQIVGALVAEQGSHALLALTWRSFNRLFSLSFLAMAVVIAGLLGYASWLSMRIRRLHRATEQCFGRDGRLRMNFPVSNSDDELGELSRSINGMLGRIENHTEYLRTLGSKLSHELRTPLAVVRSSLDNLEHENISDDARVYAQRALSGADRLGGLLSTISEANRLESMVDDAAFRSEKEIVDLGMMLEDLYQAYSGVYSQSRFHLEPPENTCLISLYPELVVQAMDKLVSNAVDFCPEQGLITLRLINKANSCSIEVENTGSLLPESMQNQLFNSMVSVRSKRGDKAHLGLGLYIVRLVMACHGGEASGANLNDGTGVVFRLDLPRGQY